MNDRIQALTEGESLVLAALGDEEAGAVIAAALGQLIGAHHIKRASLFNLVTAVMAMRTDVGGTLTIKVPPKSNAPLEAEWSSAVA